MIDWPACFVPVARQYITVEYTAEHNHLDHQSGGTKRKIGRGRVTESFKDTPTITQGLRIGLS